MKEELVEKLTEFGLSINQAKTYLSIIQRKAANVNTIAEATQLHKQDIYKILPKLEEKGLITLTVDSPITIEAIPVEQALRHIVTTEQQKANQRIKQLNKCVKALANALKENQKAAETTTPKHEETAVVYLSTDKTIRNRLDASYKNAKTKCNLVLNFELLMRRIPLLRKRFQALSVNKVKTRILIDAPQNQNLVEKTLEEILANTGNFTIKLTTSEITVKPYLIIDHKEIYISTQKKTQLYLPCLLWTNSQNIISVYEDNFEKAWNNPHASAIPTAKTQQPRKPHQTA